jgi:hypothetical protein
MAMVHIPRIRGNFGGVVIPRALFDGANHGLGIFCGERHHDPAAVERDVRRLAKGQGLGFAGALDLPAGRLVAVEMPADPARLFMQLGLTQAEVRDQINAVNLRDPGEEDVVNRWRNFQQLNHRALDGASEAEREAFQMRALEVGTNGKGAMVIETPFGRSFSDGGQQHAEWQIASDGQRKGQGGRASLFLRAYDMGDWSFLARGLVAQLHRFPEQPIGTADLVRLMEVARTPTGPDMEMDRFRELIEAEIALVRGAGAVFGRDFAEAVSVGFPPHDPKDRGGRRVVFAQFSTPPAVAEVAAEFLKPDGRTVFEPTIGNGVFAAPTYGAGGLLYGIEIDEARHGRAATALPNARILLGDALDTASLPRSGVREDGLFDAVLANPPYAKPDQRLEKVIFDSFGLSLPAEKLETHIAASAINRLREGGNAVLVMPAQMMRPSELGQESRRFQTMLNAVFRKVDSVVLDASLYRNMGSNFPVIVHFCEDRRPAGQALDVAEAARRVPQALDVMGTFAAFYERATAIIQASRIAGLSPEEAARNRAAFLGSAVPETQPDAGPRGEDGGAERPDTAPEGGGPGDAGPDETGAVAAPPRADAGQGGPRAGRATGARSSPEPLPERPGAGAGSEAETAPVGESAPDLQPPSKTEVREWFVDDFSPDPFTVPYTPRSRKGTTLAVIERTMANETYTALRRVEEAVGKPVDAYVAERMGVSEEEFLSDRVLFYPEQVDSLALSFYRRSSGKATIIGDQMGVGKGIQLAAHAYSSLATENRPVLFMTNRANLFSDLCIRDWKNASGRRFLDMVGSGEVRPFIFNTDGALRDNEEVVFSTSAEARKDAQKEKSLGNANFVMMTYSQVQTASGAWRHQTLKNWITDNVRDGRRPVILLDEAHKAAGEESRTGLVIQDLLSHAEREGVEIVYSSATSLKSGRNLPVYAPALPDTGLSTEELLLAIEKMPLAMQEVLASEMARDGALIERKMSDAGLNRELVVLADIDPEKMERTRAMTDRVSELLRELAEMGPVIAEAARRQFIGRLGGALIAGSADKVRVETTSVASQLDSFSRYLMGSVKGQFVSELLQDAVARGNKPSVVCEYTADSVSEFVIGDQLSLLSDAGAEGVVVRGHPNIGDVLRRFAEKALVFKGVDGLGNTSELRVEGFDGWLDSFLAKVDDAGVEEMRVNVFDRAREAVEAMAMTFEDITGRKYEFRTGEDGRVRAFLREKPVTADAVARYNRGQTDCLALNSGSATGVSAQASRAHGRDVRRREMIKLAFQREITDERQVEGRVHRAGQVVPPRYTIPVTGFAPDDRIANLFNRANRSLTSSTSATRENRTNADHAVDILNPVGERAAVQVLKRNPMIADMLQIDPEKSQDVARKLLGRSVMLPLAEQSAILSEVDATFRVIADKLTAEGSNPLRLQFYDWKAKVETVEDLIPGDPGSLGIAAEPLRLNQVTFLEKVESLPTKTVLGNIMETTRRRDEPFENMHKAWSYDTLIDRGAINYEHHLFGSVTGRAQEGMRYLWPMPLPHAVADEAMRWLLREMRAAEGKLSRPPNGDEFREISEGIAQMLLDGRGAAHEFHDYRKGVVAKLGEDAFKTSTVALALRAMWNRTEQARRLDKVLPLVEPGRLVALDVRAVSSVVAGMWGSAYERVDLKAGLVPALVTSARYAADAPFAESKMGFSVFVPGSRFTERLTLSALQSGMEVSGAASEPPIRPFSTFLSLVEVGRSQYRTALQEATQTALAALMSAEGLRQLQERIAQLRERERDGARLDNVVAGGLSVTEVGGAMFSALAEAMPQQNRKQERITLEGNLFAAMSAVSSSVASATSGEKVVYTDENGTHHNAILLNNRETAKLVENVKRKVAKRSVVHSGLTTPEGVGDYLRLTNAIQFGVHFYDRDGQRDVLDALERFYPGEFGGAGRERATENFAETLAAFRVRMASLDSTFPPSVMAGGDIWRWATDIAQKAAMQTEKPRGYMPGIGGPASMRVKVDDDANALGFRDATVAMGVQPAALAAAVGSIERSQALALTLVRGEVTLVLHKDHEALRAGDATATALMDRMGQRLFDAKLKAGVLAGEFTLSDPADRMLVSQVLVGTGTGKVELLIGGGMKEIQKALSAEVEERMRGRVRAGLAAEALAAPVAAEAAVASVPPGPEPLPRARPAYGMGVGRDGP